MPRSSSRGRQRWMGVALGLAACVSAAWFLPSLSGQRIEPLPMPATNLIGEPAPSITIFRTADELHQSTRGNRTQLLLDVDWKTKDVVRVRKGAAGYMTDGDTAPRYGNLELASRMGGARLFVYLHNSTPYLFSGEVRDVFSMVIREAWWVVPKGTPVEWKRDGLSLQDLFFAIATAVLSFSCLCWLFAKPAVTCGDPECAHCGTTHEPIALDCDEFIDQGQDTSDFMHTPSSTE